jgi:hypothetical protein
MQTQPAQRVANLVKQVEHAKKLSHKKSQKTQTKFLCFLCLFDNSLHA